MCASRSGGGQLRRRSGTAGGSGEAAVVVAVASGAGPAVHPSTAVRPSGTPAASTRSTRPTARAAPGPGSPRGVHHEADAASQRAPAGHGQGRLGSAGARQGEARHRDELPGVLRRSHRLPDDGVVAGDLLVAPMPLEEQPDQRVEPVHGADGLLHQEGEEVVAPHVDHLVMEHGPEPHLRPRQRRAQREIERLNILGATRLAMRRALADLEAAGHLDAVLSQNVDGLHTLAAREVAAESEPPRSSDSVSSWPLPSGGGWSW